MKQMLSCTLGALSLVLSGCGGGSGGGGSTPETLLPILQTGQSVVYADYDDGDYRRGMARSYSRDESTQTVTDEVTGLMWEDGAHVVTNTDTWQEQKSYCSALQWGGHSDWRIPSIEELRSIVDYSAPNIAFDNAAFYQLSSGYLWSDTGAAGLAGYGWALHANSGRHSYYDRSNSYYVRCVRTAFAATSAPGGTL